MRSRCALLAPLFAAALLAPLPAPARVAPPVPPDAGVLAITDVTVIDCTGAPARPGSTVLIKDGRITALGKAGAVPIPRGARVVPGRGHYLIPGLWDMHVHVSHATFADLFLANGVTGVRHMYSPTLWFSARQWRKPPPPGGPLWPRLVGADRMLDGHPPALSAAVNWKVRVVKSEAQARLAVRDLKRSGEDFIKVYPLLPRPIYLAAADEARRQRIPLVGHVPHLVRVREAVLAGQRSIEHLSNVALACSPHEEDLLKELAKALRDPKLAPFDRATAWRFQVKAYASYDPARAEALFRLFVGHGTWHVPTLVQKQAWGELANPAFLADKRVNTLPRELQWLWEVKRQGGGVNVPTLGLRFNARDLADHRRQFRKDLEVVGAMHRRGVRLLAGTDSPSPYCVPGFSLHDELALLFEAGLTPLEALQTATRNPAQFLGRDKDLGTVEVGKVADLVLLEADPLDDITNTRKVAAVVLGGQLIDRKARQALLDRPARGKQK
jgi:imidazolonepropionase-like amidohydrolase